MVKKALKVLLWESIVMGELYRPVFFVFFLLAVMVNVEKASYEQLTWRHGINVEVGVECSIEE